MALWRVVRGGLCVGAILAAAAAVAGRGDGRAHELVDQLRRRFPALAARLPRAPAGADSTAVSPPRRLDQALGLRVGGVAVAWRARGVRPAVGIAAAGVTVYRDGYRDADVLRVAADDHVEDFVYLRSPRAPTRFVYDVAVTGGRLTPAGEVVDEAGVARVHLARPWAVDATGRIVEPEIEVSDAALVVTLDARGLTYPILLDPAWEAAGALTVARHDHALALLGDGRLLACGGTPDDVSRLQTCEVSAPTATQWSTLAAPMSTDRRGATATVLPTGRVLVCGGGPATCERLDPAAGTWAAAAAMAAPRQGATAVLLRSGRVLMTGGEAAGTAEVYDPWTDTWASAGTTAPRVGAAVVRLSDGRVMAVGGTQGAGPVADVDLYDPATNAWSSLTPLPAPRAEHTATVRRDGTVLVAGGTSGAGTLATAVAYDVATGTWSPPITLRTPRRRHAAALTPSGDLLLLGGRDDSTPLASVEALGPLAAAFQVRPPLALAREGATAAVLPGGAVMLVGGRGSRPLASVERYHDHAGWSVTGSLATARAVHGLTLLRDGRVLALGGWDGTTNLLSAEIFDPVTGTWAAAAAPPRASKACAPLTLGDGRVFVAGGEAVDLPALAALLYDPASDTWGETAPYGFSVQYGLASLLADGRPGAVLVEEFGPVRTLIYDPVGDAWTRGADLPDPAAGATLTTLADGRLLAGGPFSSGNSAWLYDRSQDTWSPAAYFGGLPLGSTATLRADGTVLFAGAEGGPLYDPPLDQWRWAGTLPDGARAWNAAAAVGPELVLVAGGYANYTTQPAATDVTYAYHATTSAWTAAGHLAAPRAFLAMAPLADGRQLACGGLDTRTMRIVGTTDVFDPGWRWCGAAPPPGVARVGHGAAALPDGRVLVVGGSSGSGPADASAEVYDPASDSWTPTGSLVEGRHTATTTLLADGRVLVTGGVDSLGASLAAETYAAASGTWATVASMGGARERHTATLLADGRVLVVGGAAGGSSSLETTEVYDPATDTWAPAAPLAGGRRAHVAALLRDGRVLVAGGRTNVQAPFVDVYDPASDTWAPRTTMSTARSYATATRLGDGRVLLAGGWTGGDVTATTDLFDPAQGVAVPGGTMLHPRQHHRATLLRDGRVLISGGEDGLGHLIATAEVYDPATDRFGLAGFAHDARDRETATLLADGRVLIVGGDPTLARASADLFDPEGRAVDESRRPLVSAAPPPTAPGGALSLTGLRFRGAGTNDGRAAADAPIVGLQHLNGDQPRWLAPTAFDDQSLTVTVPPDHGVGLSRITVFVAGVASRSVTLSVRVDGEGATCASGAACASGHCVDQLCCRDLCALCFACGQPDSVGLCAPLPLGVDDLEAPAATCTGERTCDGHGACKLRNGRPCGGDDSRCASGHCVGGVCCESACTQTCATCNLAASPGRCAPRPQGSADPSTCPAPAACDGAGGCKKQLGTSCGDPAECASGHCVDGACCDQACAQPCWSCVVAGSLGTCAPTPPVTADPPDCAGGRACDGAGACKVANGQPCGAAADCASGACADGVCCDSDCAGSCRACNQPGFAGQCRPYPLGADPEDECTRPTACAGYCNGLGACTFPGSWQQCDAPHCAGYAVSVGAFCDGLGECARAAVEPCGGGYVCNAAGSACLGGCGDDQQCQPGYYCDLATTTCRVRAPNGATCVRGEECASGSCLEGTCCAAPWCDGFRCLGGACGTSCARDDQCASGWTCDVLGGACLAPVGAVCGTDAQCQTDSCAGGRCCATRCRGRDPTCGGSCDEVGRCAYPHEGAPCACAGGGGGTCQAGECACEAADGGGADASAADGPGPPAGGGCGCRHARPRVPGALAVIVLVGLRGARRRRHPGTLRPSPMAQGRQTGESHHGPGARARRRACRVGRVPGGARPT